MSHFNDDKHSTKSQKKRSITKALALILAMTVVIVTIVTVSISYFIISRRAKVLLEEKADEYIASLTKVLEIPIWNLDETSIRSIGETYAHNDLFDKIKITDNSGNVHFDFSRGNGMDVVKRSGRILYNGRILGSVEIFLSARSNAETNRRFLISELTTMIVVVLVLMLVTAYLSRIFLRKIQYKLGIVVNAYVSGKYDYKGHDIWFLEFQPLVEVLAEMGDKINLQMTELRDAEKKYRSIFENAVEGIFQTTPDGRLLNANPSTARMLGYDSVEDAMKKITNIGQQVYVNPDRRRELVQLLSEGKNVSGFQIEFFRKDRSKVWVSLNAHPILDGKGELIMIEGIIEDITEKLSLESQLRQSQKMEAIGKLAGGVAHDFNNILSIILGYGEIMLMELQQGHPHRDLMDQIIRAGVRARDLTRQLLAFSRKQVLEVKPVDVNEVVSGFEKLLRRVIGEDITLKLILTSEPCLVIADIGQLEQVFMNLAVNARDAMPDGGTFTIETGLTELDETYANSKPGVTSGKYVFISISDTGHGMDDNTVEHIFDPFFTTKEKGTGLGLSTSYGIIKQHEGNIWVYSEPDKGTTFKIYLPVSKEDVLLKHKNVQEPVDLRGWEIIILVEDNEEVRRLASDILTRQGYTVLSAESGDAALAKLSGYSGPLHLLLTDVVMPGISGKELHELISKRFPRIKVLYMSGYTDDLIAHHGVLEKGVHFIQKPFSIQTLAAKVRAVLDGIE